MPASEVRVAGETEGSGEADPEERMPDAQNWHVTPLWWVMVPTSSTKHLCRHRAEQLVLGYSG